jgi:hypothetical protein
VTEITDCTLFGLAVRSELALPGFPAAAAAGEPNGRVEIRFGAVPTPAGEGKASAEGRDFLLDIPDVGRFRISDGREIVIDPRPGVSERNIRVYLLGSAFGVLLHQRGLVPLHANAIEIGGKAVAFSGRSGAGKSTLAAWFADRGHRVLCDDVCAIGFAEDGTPIAWPGIPRLRLWQDAVLRSGRGVDSYERSFDGQDKYDVPTGVEPSAEPLPLAACYLLAEADEGEPASIRTLTGTAAVEALIANTYRGGFLRLIGGAERHWRSCVRIASRAKIYRAERRWGEDRFEDEALRLARHAAADGA